MAGEAHLGGEAPDFTLPSSGGPVSLRDLRGRRVVLYFYPKADTPGCTQETIDFNRLHAAFEACGTAIVGMSADPLKAQEKFGSKYGVTFPLASDNPDQRTLSAYGVWAEKSMYGRKFMGIVRSTFLIDSTGRIARIWRNVKVPGHVDEVLAAAEALKAEGI
jgi:thioredoxin-dependent peroxiredoxin